MGTLVCILVDSLCFCVQYRWFIEGTADHSNFWMMFASIGFLIYDTIHIFYLLTLKRTLPNHVNAWLWEAVFGDQVNLIRQIKSQLSPTVDDDFVDHELETRRKEIEEEIQ